MARLCALLAEEMRTWPGVSDRAMFGYRAFFRDATIFAMLPEKRLLDNPAAIAYKLDIPHQPIGRGRDGEGQKWRVFEMNDDRSIAGAIATLEKAYSRSSGRR
jgi:hypothetical protein